MTAEAQGRRRWRIRLAVALAAIALFLAVILVPPLVNVGRYKGRISQVLSASLGRPVRLSSVELRLFPRPGFVLTDLTVEEDPAYGAEPVVHANTVTAAIRLTSLWRGLEISRISVDEASVNLVRTGGGRWNVESLLRSASQRGGFAADGRPRRKASVPYLEATESRINVKFGVEKLPFSLINADASFWQEEPGEWRIRLRGQPARTDLSLNLADTGIVRLEADLRRAPELEQIPLHIDMEWSEAQLGQLTRLLVGSDAGWRGDLTGEIHVDGTPDNAQIKTRLRATGVHRAEFAPAAPMDFDAACGFVYHFSSRAVDGLECSSPVGDGRVRLTGSLAGEGAAPKFSIELDRLPVAAALDALRTVRRDVAGGLEANGTVSGKITYAEPAAPSLTPARPLRVRAGRPRTPAPGPFAGSMTVQGFELAGNDLNQPVRVARMVLEPAAEDAAQEPARSAALTATAQIPAGAVSPLTLTSRLSLSGYRLSVRGQASMAHLRDLVLIAGLVDKVDFSGLSAQAVTVEMEAAGPWLPANSLLAAAGPAEEAGPDRIDGTLNFRDATWKASFLANPMEIAQATLHIEGGQGRWEPVVFTYGPVHGTASLAFPIVCGSPPPCVPRFQLSFAALGLENLQKAILGSHEAGTLLSELIARISPSQSPAWPELEGAVDADSLVLGPVTLEHPSAMFHIRADGVEISALDGGLFGGQLHLAGSMQAPRAEGNAPGRPSYHFEGQFDHLNPPALGKLLGQRWAGGEIRGTGAIDLAGFTANEFAESAGGALHFEWRRGSVAAQQAGEDADEAGDSAAEKVPAALARFDLWTGDAVISKGAITLEKNEVRRGARRAAVAASVALADPAAVSFGASIGAQTAKR